MIRRQFAAPFSSPADANSSVDMLVSSLQIEATQLDEIVKAHVGFEEATPASRDHRPFSLPHLPDHPSDCSAASPSLVVSKGLEYGYKLSRQHGEGDRLADFDSGQDRRMGSVSGGLAKRP
jgi:hypothetical protein